MTIEPVNTQELLLTIELNCWQVVWQGGPNLGVEFEDARFCQSREDRISRGKQLENSADGGRRAIFGLNGGGTYN
jgi:hypothetical protein